MPSAQLDATGITRERGTRTVLAGVSMSIGPEDRVGVVGPNGVGKSTLLRILAGLEQPEQGRVVRRPAGATIGYFSQERKEHGEQTVLAYLTRRTGVAGAEADLAAAADRLAEAAGSGRRQGNPGQAHGTAEGGNPGRAAEEGYAEALERWTALGAADLDSRIVGALADLGLDAGLLDRPTGGLSGGQAARVDLAAILLSRFDLVLLDEPTNDLDFEGLERLEAFLLSRRGGLAVVSHDRVFLERVITSVLEIDEHTHTATTYRGGWAAFQEEKATVRQHAEEAYDLYQSRRRQLTDRARRERQWATSGVTKERKAASDHDKAQRDFRINRTEKLASKARLTERALERLEEVDKPWEGWQLRYSIQQAPRSGALVALLSGAVVERGSFRLGPMDLTIEWGERVALTGPNGSGKTTVIEALLGRLPLAAGERRIGPSVVVGELGQRRTRLDPQAGLLDGFLSLSGGTVAEVRNLLAKFGLGAGHVERRVGSLSPGERTRAELAAFQAVGVNFLILDEPTNHLDMAAIEQLESALDGYAGTLLLVSHDRRLLQAVDLTRTVPIPG